MENEGSSKLRQVLRERWRNLKFGRVSRIVCRAQDLNIWYKDAKHGRVFLGDNRETLKRFTREQISNVTFEYDYFYGFTGEMDEKEKLSRFVPSVYNVHDREVTEDTEDLGIDKGPEAPMNEHDYDHEVAKAKEKDIEFEDNINNVVPGETRDSSNSMHFSSVNFKCPLIFTPTFSYKSDDPFGADTYIVVPPKLGTLVCGETTTTKKGTSLSSWWICSESFFELWKLIMSDKMYPSNYSFYDDMRRLKWRSQTDGPFSRFYQEIALCAVFEKCPEKLEDKTSVFIEALKARPS